MNKMSNPSCSYGGVVYSVRDKKLYRDDNVFICSIPYDVKSITAHKPINLTDKVSANIAFIIVTDSGDKYRFTDCLKPNFIRYYS